MTDTKQIVELRAWERLEALDAAQRECRRVADETTFGSDVMPGEREWYKRGAQACAAMTGMLASNAAKGIDFPAPTAPTDDITYAGAEVLPTAPVETARLVEALRLIAETQRDTFRGSAVHSAWCQKTSREALAAMEANHG